jgi:hypothetical protein
LFIILSTEGNAMMHMTPKTAFPLAFMTALAALVVLTAAPAPSDGGSHRTAWVSGFGAGADEATITLHAADYSVTWTADGQRIEMEGFGYLGAPGRPQLPVKTFLVALPPGARTQSVEVLGAGTTRLPGEYRIAPRAPIMPLPDTPHFADHMERMRSEWQAGHDAVYLADEPWPGRIAWISGSGGLRKYSYASVAFCPFTYYPESGRLDYHSEVTVTIRYSLPEPGSDEEEAAGRLMYDNAADERAADLFVNYRDVERLYRPDPMQPAPLDETYDYVILTTSSLAGAITASDFPAWKAALGYNLRTVLITDAEITGQPGADLAERIRNFLRAYYAAWGIEYVLIVGDYATVPMRICYPDSAFHVYDPGDPGLIAPGTPTDCYYADLSLPDADSWDLDGDGYPGEYNQDSPDFLAEVSVGRIPVNDAARITYALDKSVAFEQDTGAWKTNALHAAAILFFENQNYSGYPFIDGATVIDSIERGLMNGWTVTRMSEQAGIVTSPFPWPAITEAVFNTAWRDGQFAVVNWSGHGWSDGAYRTVWEWDDGDGVPESSNGEMRSYQFIHISTSDLEDDYPSVVFAISCNVGYPDPNPYGNCGIDLLTLPGWGASVAMVSASRPASISADWMNSPGGTEQICYEFNRYLVAEGERVGDALYDGKYYATSTYGWDRLWEYMNLYNYNLYGDPALELGGASAGVIMDPGDDKGAAVRLMPARPNPFASSTTLRFALAAAGRVRVAVHDVRGREVAVIADGPYEAGEFSVTWDGTDGAGKSLGPGLYFAAVEACGRRAVRKMVLLR